MFTNLRTALRSRGGFRNLNYFVHHRVDFKSSAKHLIVKHIEGRNIDTILDVGANIGQFGIDLTYAGYRDKIISFEPEISSFTILQRNSRKRKHWIAINLGLGSSESKLLLNVSGNYGLRSSFLSMEQIHLENLPSSRIVHTQEIAISTLDRQLKILNVNPNSALLKLDVQGFEYEVLKGARDSLSKIPYCFFEVSLVQMYRNEGSLLDLLNYLSNFGHEVIDIFRGTKSDKGVLLQVDVLTKNRDS